MVALFELVPLRKISGVFVAAAALLLSAGAYALPFQLTIQPINVCNDAGTGCANPAEILYEAESQKIWAQAGIEISFLPFNAFNDTDYLVIDGSTDSSAAPSFASLRSTPGHGQNGDSNILNLWFVDEIAPADPGTTFGIAVLGANGVAISNDIFLVDRIDTIAHEIGHNLGLNHASALDDDDNLMEQGSQRNVPTSILDIAPDGLMYDQLTGTQIATATESSLVSTNAIPEPAGILMLLSGLLVLAGTIRFAPGPVAALRA